MLEIKGENRFKPWRQDIELEAGAIQKVHATLVPTVEVVKAAPPQRAEAAARKPTARAEGPRPTRSPSRRATARRGRAPSRGASSAARPTPPPLDAVAEAHAQEAARHGRVGRRRDSSDDSDGDAAEAAEGGDCSITIGSRPWSEVWIDGRNTTKHTPFADYKIPCGKHKLSFKRPDLQIDHTETISVRAGQKFKQSFTLETEQPE